MKRAIEALFKNIAETSDHHPYIELRSRYYKGTKKQVFQAILEVLKAKEWEIVHIDEERGEIVVIRKTPIMKVKSDIVITLFGVSPVKWSVDIRSASRSSFGDLGYNRRYILEFFHSLNKRIEQVSN